MFVIVTVFSPVWFSGLFTNVIKRVTERFIQRPVAIVPSADIVFIQGIVAMVIFIAMRRRRAVVVRWFRVGESTIKVFAVSGELVVGNPLSTSCMMVLIMPTSYMMRRDIRRSGTSVGRGERRTILLGGGAKTLFLRDRVGWGLAAMVAMRAARRMRITDFMFEKIEGM